MWIDHGFSHSRFGTQQTSLSITRKLNLCFTYNNMLINIKKHLRVKIWWIFLDLGNEWSIAFSSTWGFLSNSKSPSSTGYYSTNSKSAVQEKHEKIKILSTEKIMKNQNYTKEIVRDGSIWKCKICRSHLFVKWLLS